MRPTVAAFFGGIIALAIVALPFWYKARASVTYRNFRVVDRDQLYRSGQMTPEGFDRVVSEYGIRTVISLRETKDEGGTHQDSSEDEYCRTHGMTFYRFKLADWTEIDGRIPGNDNIEEFLKILAKPETQKPILIHCFAGIHRTGPHCAVYRMEYDGWSNADAIEEMKSMGTVRTTFADNLITYLTNYKPRRIQAAEAVIGGSVANR
ncbi:fused DSP-PTPase phosphatase/NAD kinase-like protein [Fimbriiglobus ruber]|uniref:Protein tyrosine/serine phosphatase n=1 Tax=Fimbriiglobus ruber TaxID=1908690 RepID=A0A225D9W7_9BACT|nr:tyrosine-protein phosphatase [Fimbriiglobus ruber]OWK36454.1 Protein tyrosine/serine phosphatase [Fimbriiglobus ruber]